MILSDRSGESTEVVQAVVDSGAEMCGETRCDSCSRLFDSGQGHTSWYSW